VQKVMWGHKPPSLPSLPFFSFSCTLSLPFFFLSLPLKVGPSRLGVWESAFAPQRVRAEPGRQTLFGEFKATNLASSSNDLQELFRKCNIKMGDFVAKWYCGDVTYLTFMPDCQRSFQYKLCTLRLLS